MKEVFVNDRPHTIVEFKSDWDARHTSSDIDELYNVVIHENVGSNRFAVPPPTSFPNEDGFTATWSSGNVEMTWEDNADNEGCFKIFRQPWNGDLNITWYDDPHLIDHAGGTNTESYTDNDDALNSMPYGQIIAYGIRTLTCDTSIIVEDTARKPFPGIAPARDIADVIPLLIADIDDPMIPGESGEIAWAAAIDENTGEEPDDILIDVSYDEGVTYTNVATVTDPGSYKLLGTEVNDDGYTIAYYGYDGEESWTPSSSLNPSSFLKYRYRVVLESGDTVTGYSRKNYTLANGSGFAYSTGYTGYKFDYNDDKIGMVYSDENYRVQYAESDDGVVWDTTILVDSAGVLPTLAMVDTIPIVVWRDTSSTNNSIDIGISGQSAYPFYDGPGYPIQIHSEVGLHAMGADSFCVGVVATYGQSLYNLAALSLTEVRAAPTDTSFGGVNLYYVSNPDTFIDKAPAMVVDANHNTYYAFEYDDKTIFIYHSGANTYVDTLSDSAWCHPSMTISAGNVDVLYADVVSGDSALLRKSHYLGADGWHPRTDTAIDPLDYFLLCSSAGPYVLAEDADHDLSLLCWDEIAYEMETEALTDSCFNPSMRLSRVNDDPELMMCWTRKVDSNYYVVSERVGMSGTKVSHARHYGGDGDNDPMTVLCSTTDTYGSYDVDVIADSIKYRVENLDTSIDYKLYLEFYGDPDGSDSTEVIVTAAGEVDTVSVYADSLVVDTLEIDSLGSDLDIKLANDDDAGMVRYVLYEEPESDIEYFMPGVEEPPTPTVTPFCLYQPFPNPFNNKTTIRYSIPYAAHVDLKVYDVTGRVVTNLISDNVEPGVHELLWNGKDDLRRKCAAGVYFVRFETEDYQASKKMVLVK
ncbi:T9SS type A sorting domain-containing protein [candidate division WOR-3 bacterium]|nr:T9SS type A sorting domain-containing protein [candidate division WOR-3 bacterium]